MKTFYNFDEPVFKQHHDRIRYEFILGSQFLVFHLRNGLRHAANVSGFFSPLTSIDVFLDEMKRREIVTVFLNLHPILEEGDFLRKAQKGQARLSLFDLSKPFY